MSLQFLDFNLEASSQCRWDWLKIRDGDDASAIQIGEKLCGDQSPNPIVSSGNALYIYFHSDGSVESSGFKIQVDVGKNHQI